MALLFGEYLALLPSWNRLTIALRAVPLVNSIYFGRFCPNFIGKINVSNGFSSEHCDDAFYYIPFNLWKVSAEPSDREKCFIFLSPILVNYLSTHFNLLHLNANT